MGNDRVSSILPLMKRLNTDRGKNLISSHVYLYTQRLGTIKSSGRRRNKEIVAQCRVCVRGRGERFLLLVR